MKVFEVMSASTVAISADATLRSALERMGRELFRHLPVLDHQRLVGLISERDLLEATGKSASGFEEPGERAPKLVRDYMQPDVETAAPDEPVAEAAARLREHAIGCLPVVESGELCGVLTEHDLLRAYVRVFERGGESSPQDPPLAQAMSREVVRAETTTSVADALALCRERGIRHLPVMHEGWLVGVVSDRDLRAASGRGEERLQLEAVMSKDMVCAAPDEPLWSAATRMLARRIGSVLVTDNGRLEGLVTTSDIVRRFADGAVG